MKMENQIKQCDKCKKEINLAKEVWYKLSKFLGLTEVETKYYHEPCIKGKQSFGDRVGSVIGKFFQ